MHFSDLHILESTMPLIIEFFYQNKKPTWKILRTDKNNNFKFTIKFLMTLDRSYIGYLGFLGIDLFKSVLMYSNGAICLIKLLFDLGLFTVYTQPTSASTTCCSALSFLLTVGRPHLVPLSSMSCLLSISSASCPASNTHCTAIF